MKVRGPKTSQLEVQPRPFAITYTVILRAEKAKLVRSLDKAHPRALGLGPDALSGLYLHMARMTSEYAEL
jgi:hypothetical protein